MKATAWILTDGSLSKRESKTAHGLIFGDSRYDILGIIDANHPCEDAGILIANQPTNIPVYASIQHALKMSGTKPDYCIVGVAPVGGKLSYTLVQTIIEAIHEGIDIVSGLHSFLSDHPEIAPLAKEKSVTLLDIRKPKPIQDLAMWTGNIASVKIPRIAVLGTDCALGKRTTANLLLRMCLKKGLQAEMIYTGQTGWLSGMPYGFILDSTVNDFVSGELEHAILQCAKEKNPDIIFLEGQSSLRNPAGPCGAEFLLSAGAKYVILQHSPKREYFTCDTTGQHRIPDITEEINLIKYYGAAVIALTINSEHLKPEEHATIRASLAHTRLPIIFPREEGVEALFPTIQNVIGAFADEATV